MKLLPLATSALALAITVTTAAAVPMLGGPRHPCNSVYCGELGGPSTEPILSRASTACIGGTAAGFPCAHIDLGHWYAMPDVGGGNGNDIWGWTDSFDGKEYAIFGRSSGTSFVDVSDPSNPIYLGDLPTYTFTSDWRDVKVYADHAFIVSEASMHGMQVFDLTELRSVVSPPVTFAETAHYAGFSNAHNIAINEDSGYAYAVGTNTCSGGLHIVDIATPTSPSMAGCFSADGYTHDVQCVDYAGPDPDYTGAEVCFAANEDSLTIVDVTSKGAPFEVARLEFAGQEYIHQGWLTEDHEWLLVDDEIDEVANDNNTRTLIIDVSDLDNPVWTGSRDSTRASIDHNQYIKGDHSYQANYTAGLRVLDVTDIANSKLCEVAHFDVYPSHDAATFNGAWSSYPYFDSGTVVVGSMDGMAVLIPDEPSFECTTTTTTLPPPLCDTVPETGCHTSGPNRSLLLIRDKDDDSTDVLTWKLNRTDATELSEFLDPTTPDADYRVCVYDASGGSQPLTEVAVLTGGLCDGKSCWKAAGSSGFRYRDGEATPDGVTTIKLRADDDTRGHVQVRGKGANLNLPELALAEPVTIQLLVTDGIESNCWQALYSETRKNTTSQFKAKGP